MSLPPKGDPQRPLRLASRLARVFGVLFIAIGTLSVLPYLIAIRGGRSGFVGFSFFMLPVVVFYILPGGVYLLCSIFLARRRKWAVIVAQILAAVHLGLGAFALVTFAVRAPWADEPILLIPMSVVLIFAVALAAMEYHLSKCYEAIRRPPVDVHRGFEPLPAARVALPAVVAEDAAHGDAHG